jgi:DNA-directed RNA polymerase specialized sigma54-like protein|tara:strand:+ start:353 stop:556 length:204 start_codon:yes stop_codon:yes gene_type:complete
MAKEAKVDLKQEAQTKMESMVEQHNALVQELQGANERLAEIKQMIIEHQGYMKGLEACEESCEPGEK